MSRLRVAERVAHGGHDIPADDIAHRFPRSLHNLFHLFAQLVNQTRCFMNSGEMPELVFQQNGTQRVVFYPEFFEVLPWVETKRYEKVRVTAGAASKRAGVPVDQEFQLEGG